MLYRCDCDIFNIKNNNYRKIYRDLVYFYSSCFLSHKSIFTIVIVLFEPGGLLDEYLIIKKINDRLNISLSIKIVIYIIEPDLESNPSIKQAHDYFCKKFSDDYNILIKYAISIFNLKEEMLLISFDYLLFLSLDPYQHCGLKFYKNFRYDVLNIINKVYFFLDISLFSISGFFYDCELTFIVYNKFEANDIFFQYRFFGKNNKIVYSIQSNNYFN